MSTSNRHDRAWEFQNPEVIIHAYVPHGPNGIRNELIALRVHASAVENATKRIRYLYGHAAISVFDLQRPARHVGRMK